ncbi:MAG: DUF1343 domain-containing protein [Bacteroidota bacterium]|nr:DUF1343 domain-containing protein [Bacteroidota bacterium]
MISPGAWSVNAYLPLLEGKNVGLVVNQSSLIGQIHLVDSLLSRNVRVVRLFAPEHGLRGNADAGEVIKDGFDTRTGLKVISLYGEKKKPSKEDLTGVDVMVFDIQDVGVRFFTYISTLHYLMEGLAEAGVPLIILDRPNPNGHYIDGPVIDTSAYQSFVGMHPIPVVHGLTIGEYGRMINGEKWIKQQCELTVIPCKNYDHSSYYELPVKPSPNLPNIRSILLYPGICFFEGTVASLGRGTNTPFQVAGHPDYPDHSFSFTPVPTPGALHPPLEGKRCYGEDLSNLSVDSLFRLSRIELSTLINFYKKMDASTFFNASWFDKLAGGPSLRESIQAGWSEQKIRDSWTTNLKSFQQRRKLYLLYPDAIGCSKYN